MVLKRLNILNIFFVLIFSFVFIGNSFCMKTKLGGAKRKSLQERGFFSDIDEEPVAKSFAVMQNKHFGDILDDCNDVDQLIGKKEVEKEEYNIKEDDSFAKKNQPKSWIHLIEKDYIAPEPEEKLYNSVFLNSYQRPIFNYFEITEKEVKLIMQNRREYFSKEALWGIILDLLGIDEASGFGFIEKLKTQKDLEVELNNRHMSLSEKIFIIWAYNRASNGNGMASKLEVIYAKLNMIECFFPISKVSKVIDLHELLGGQLSILLLAIRTYRKFEKQNPGKDFFLDFIDESLLVEQHCLNKQ